MEIFRTLTDALIARGLHIAAAESCTGGMFASRIVDIPDASKVLGASFITYSEDAKCAFAGVDAGTIEKYGVVSEEVAAEMASGAAAAAKAEVGVGITGFAGPTGGTEKAPAGTVCFGFFCNGKTRTETVHYGTIGRNAVRDKAACHAAERIVGILEE